MNIQHLRLIGPLLLVCSIHAAACCEEFVHNVDLNGNYTKHLERAEKVRVWNEAPNGLLVRYWAPSKTGVEGELVYGYHFKRPIKTASVRGNLLPFIDSDRVAREVSADDKDYVVLTTVRQHPSIEPPYSITIFDLTEHVRGSKSVYIRVRLRGTQINTDIMTAQFMRTAENIAYFLSPNVYEFKAETE